MSVKKSASLLGRIAAVAAVCIVLGCGTGHVVFAQTVLPGSLAPCKPLAASDTPNHGSGDVNCNEGKVFYRAEQPVHVNVEVTGTKLCEAILNKNLDANNRNGKECGKTNDRASFTCFDVKNLELECRGQGKESCSYRITQITIK